MIDNSNLTEQELIKKFKKATLPALYKSVGIEGVFISEAGNYPVLIVYRLNDGDIGYTTFTINGCFSDEPDSKRDIIFSEESVDKQSTTTVSEPIDFSKSTKTIGGHDIIELVKSDSGNYYGTLDGLNSSIRWNKLGINYLGLSDDFDLAPPKSEYQTTKEKLERVTETRDGTKVLEVMIPSEDIWNKLSESADHVLSAYLLIEEKVSIRTFSKYGKYYTSGESDLDLIY